jgi:ATP-dependent Clp protease, protease subunit
MNKKWLKILIIGLLSCVTASLFLISNTATILPPGNDGYANRGCGIFDRLLQERIIFLGEAIDNDVANSIVARLLYLDSLNSTQPIYLYINSPGGSVNAGLAIYDTMQAVHSPVSTISIGLTASAATLILAGGKAGYRMSLPSARIMIHQPLLGRSEGNSETEMRELARMRDYLNQQLSNLTGQPLDKIEQDTQQDFFMSASEAQEYGIIDTIIDDYPRY